MTLRSFCTALRFARNWLTHSKCPRTTPKTIRQLYMFQVLDFGANIACLVGNRDHTPFSKPLAYHQALL